MDAGTMYQLCSVNHRFSACTYVRPPLFVGIHLVHIIGCCPCDLSWSRPSRLLDLHARCVLAAAVTVETSSYQGQYYVTMCWCITNNFIATKVGVKHDT